MADLSDEEKRIAQQQAMADQLRGAALQPSARRDWASQAARGVQGAASAYGTYKTNKMLDQYSKDKQSVLDQAKDALMPGWRQKQNLPIAPPAAPIDYSQYGEYN